MACSNHPQEARLPLKSCEIRHQTKAQSTLGRTGKAQFERCREQAIIRIKKHNMTCRAVSEARYYAPLPSHGFPVELDVHPGSWQRLMRDRQLSHRQPLRPRRVDVSALVRLKSLQPGSGRD